MAIYIRPRNLEEALRALEEPGASPIAGGTDLVLLIRDGLAQPKYLVDIAQLEELRGIRELTDYIEIGSATKLADIEQNENLPFCLRKGARLVGSRQIRNMGTLGGNICNASPSGDTLTPLIVLEAKAVLRSANEERVIPLESFFIGPKKTIRKPEELLISVLIPQESLERKSAFSKIGGRKGMIISQVNGAISVRGKEPRLSQVLLAFGSVAPTPIRAKGAENLLEGQDIETLLEDYDSSQISREVINAVQKDISPISDQRASESYRRAVIKAILFDLLSEVLMQIREGKRL